MERSERGNLLQEREAVARAHGVAVRNLKVFLNELHSAYRQFSLRLNETMMGEFASLFKQISHYAVFAHAQRASGQFTSKFDALDWVDVARECIWMRPRRPPLIVGV